MFPIQSYPGNCNVKKKKIAKCQFMKSAQTRTCGEFGIPVIRMQINKCLFMSDVQRLKHSIHSLSEQRKNSNIQTSSVDCQSI